MMHVFSRWFRAKPVVASSVCAAALFGAFAGVNYAVAQKSPQIDDPTLKAMRAELDREKALLVLPGMQRPYFIQYRLDDIDTYEAAANYGALTGG